MAEDLYDRLMKRIVKALDEAEEKKEQIGDYELTTLRLIRREIERADPEALKIDIFRR